MYRRERTLLLLLLRTHHFECVHDMNQGRWYAGVNPSSNQTPVVATHDNHHELNHQNDVHLLDPLTSGRSVSNRTNRNETNHGTGNLTNGSAAPPPTATVAVWDVENEPRAARSRLLIFIGISSRKGAGTLRNIQRKTWLQWASDDPRVDFRFFQNPDGQREKERDLITLPIRNVSHCPGAGENTRAAHNCRSGAVVKFLLLWALENTPAHFIVATEHDGFVCLPQLILEAATSWPTSMQMAHYSGLCRFGAEQTFQVFGRSVLSRIFVLINNHHDSYFHGATFAQNLPPIMRYLNMMNMVSIIPDIDRILIGLRAQPNTPDPITELCTAGHLYFHFHGCKAGKGCFKNAMEHMEPWSVSMKKAYDKQGNLSAPEKWRIIQKTTEKAEHIRLSCASPSDSCPLDPSDLEEEAWWCCPISNTDRTPYAKVTRMPNNCTETGPRQPPALAPLKGHPGSRSKRKKGTKHPQKDSKKKKTSRHHPPSHSKQQRRPRIPYVAKKKKKGG
jgi:hypothetical protein